MKEAMFLTMLALVVSLGGCLSQAAEQNKPGDTAVNSALNDKQPVLVELFTSEGCSSCPPADKLLALLEQNAPVSNAQVITLGFHVDYWDHGGWRDRFSSAAFTKRQESYARQFKLGSTYTPQMVIDGSRELVGSNSGGAVDAIGKLAAQPKGTVTISIEGGQMHIKAEKLPEHSDATVYLAVAENKLVSSVSGGENAGSKLEHSSVVRQLSSIGTISANQNTFTVDQPLPAGPAWKRENLKYVVFVQDNATLKILGVGQSF